ncbi:hypothetical protein [Alishewanella longhuensis]
MTTEQKPGCSITLPEATLTEQLKVLQVHPRDNVLVALQPIVAGQTLPEPTPP